MNREERREAVDVNVRARRWGLRLDLGYELEQGPWDKETYLYSDSSTGVLSKAANKPASTSIGTLRSSTLLAL